MGYRQIVAVAWLTMTSLALVASEAPSNIKTLGKKVLFTGRMDYKDPDGVRWDWAGCEVAFNTDADSMTIGLKDGGNDYNVIVNCRISEVIRTRGNVQAYKLPLPGSGVREVRITKRNGPNYGSGVLTGIELAQGARFYRRPARPKRRIEFVGDSFTVGYGNEGPGKECSSLREYENNWLSFAGMTARELKAEAHMTAISGHGAVRNYGDTKQVSTDPVPFYYARTLKSVDKEWDFKKWQADVVVIKLGTNDYSTQPHPEEDVFVKGMHALIKMLQSVYGGGVPIVLVTDEVGAALKAAVSRVYREQQDKMANVSLVIFPKVIDSDLGCHWHPKVAAHENFTRTLVPVLRDKMGWKE